MKSVLMAGPLQKTQLHYLMADKWNAVSTNVLFWRYNDSTEQAEHHAEPRACIKMSLPVLN